MSNGFISVSEPLNFSKNQCIEIDDNHKQLICLLNGKLKKMSSNEMLESGDVFGLEHIIDSRGINEKLIALEDTTIIIIESEHFEGKAVSIIHGILTSTVEYINDVRENLLKGTTACRP